MDGTPESGAPRGPRLWAKNLALLLGTAWLTQLTIAVLFEEKLIYYPEKSGDWDLPMRFPGRVEDVFLDTADGVTIHAWHVLSKRPRRATLLYFHGNAGNLSHRLGWMLELAEGLSVDVLGVDYRGYGRSQGSPSEAGLYADAEAAWAWITGKKGEPAARVVVYGKSLGGAPACELALRHPPAALILQSCFTSIPAMGRHLLPFLPHGLLARHRFDNLEKVGRIDGPKLVVHSEADEVIPFAMGEALARAARPPCTWLPMAGAGHNDLIEVRKPELLAAFDALLKAAGL